MHAFVAIVPAVAVCLLAVVAPARAGDVTAQVKGGVLAITGDDGGTDVTLDIAGLSTGELRITPNAGTTLDGAPTPATFSGITKGVKVKFGDGDDRIFFAGTNVLGKTSIATGKGADHVRAEDVIFQGPVKLDVGSGDNRVELCGFDARSDVAIKAGNGSGGTALIAADCGGNPSSTLDGSAFAVTSAGILGDFTVKTAKGNDVTAFNNVAIQGALKLSYGAGVAALAFCAGTVNGPLSYKASPGIGAVNVGANCTTANYQGQGSGNSVLLLTEVALGGPVTQKGGKADDVGVFVGVTSPAGVKSDLGDGANFFGAIVSTFAGDIVAKAKKGADQFVLDQNAVVQGDVKVAYGDGANTVTVGAATIGGDLTVKTGKNDDVITTGGATVGGVRTIDPGKGSDTVS